MRIIKESTPWGYLWGYNTRVTTCKHLEHCLKLSKHLINSHSKQWSPFSISTELTPPHSHKHTESTRGTIQLKVPKSILAKKKKNLLSSSPQLFLAKDFLSGLRQSIPITNPVATPQEIVSKQKTQRREPSTWCLQPSLVPSRDVGGPRDPAQLRGICEY